ncbi:MAG TPA: hypothetical protein VJV05_08970 [Pyrinomonadaceae bacterium]|nr:hypothetical protein [Pyrinomonadaceae bacterium]
MSRIRLFLFASIGVIRGQISSSFVSHAANIRNNANVTNETLLICVDWRYSRANIFFFVSHAANIRNNDFQKSVTIGVMTIGRWIFFIVVAGSAIGIAWFMGKEQRLLGRSKNTAAVQTTGFEEITRAKDGDLVTVTDWIDIKYICMDLSPTQRDICTTALVRSDPQTTQSIEIRLRVCNDTRQTNCIVFDSEPRNVDFRKVHVLDDNGDIIDFDGEKLLEPPNTWIANAKKLRLTGRVTVVNGQGQFVEPIEKIEQE